MLHPIPRYVSNAAIFAGSRGLFCEVQRTSKSRLNPKGLRGSEKGPLPSLWQKLKAP